MPALTCFILAAASQTAKSRPNILWIMSDDHAAASVGSLPIHPAAPSHHTHDDLIIHGWKSGSVGFSAHRFGNASMRLQANFLGKLHHHGRIHPHP